MENLKNFDNFIKEGFDNVDTGIKDAKEIIEQLNFLLANHFVLFMKIWNFHWILVSKRFGPLHGLFGGFYEKFFKNIDDLAERIRALGGRPIGTLEGFLKESKIKEYDGEVPDDVKMLETLQEDFETLIKQIRDVLKDVDNGTSNFLEGIIESYEKDAWLIRSHIP